MRIKLMILRLNLESSNSERIETLTYILTFFYSELIKTNIQIAHKINLKEII